MQLRCESKRERAWSVSEGALKNDRSAETTDNHTAAYRMCSGSQQGTDAGVAGESMWSAAIRPARAPSPACPRPASLLLLT